jgi:hypothetical protein
MPKVLVGPKGGRYMIQGGKKVYVGKGAYKKKARMPVKGKGAYKRPRKVMRGKGSFWSTVKEFTESPFKTLGSKLGEITGLGEYKVNNNTLLGLSVPGGNAGVNPQIINSDSESFVIRHTEFIQDISTSEGGDFSLNAFNINPGLKDSFPWLAPIAANFEQYEVRGMIYKYRTTSSDALNSTDTSLGALICATEYNAASPPFSGKQEMENTQYFTSSKPSNDVVHPIECSPQFNPQRILYVRTGPVPTGQDPRLYDLGKFQIATVGGQGDGNVVGELSVTYEIRFLKPLLPSATSQPWESAQYLLSNVTGSNPMGSYPATQVFDNIGIDIPNSSNAIEFKNSRPNASYLILYSVTGNTGTSTSSPSNISFSGPGDLSTLNLFNGNYSYPGNASFSTPETTIQYSYAIATGPLGIAGGVAAFGSCTIPTGPTYASLIVTRINNQIATTLMDMAKPIHRQLVSKDKFESLLEVYDKKDLIKQIALDVSKKRKIKLLDAVELVTDKVKSLYLENIPEQAKPALQEPQKKGWLS